MNHRQRINALTDENKQLRADNQRLTKLNEAQAKTIEELKTKPGKSRKAKEETPADNEQVSG